MKLRSIAAVVVGASFLFVASARADERSAQEVGVQGTGFFTKDSSSNVLNQHSTNSGGFLVSYRFHFNRWFGADVSYGWNRDTQQNISSTGSLNVQSNVHQATVAAVMNLPWKSARINPYVLAGTGALVFAPTQAAGATVAGAGNQAKATFVYGGGVNYDFSKHLTFRLEYRGLVYGRPDFGVNALRSGLTTNTAQPSAGVVYRF
ncbi:MAG TPA: porin family protein [Candidatus Limnocylindrales bacterium]|nr:porin family protein [Candidatus Limnocylindrales bacterium]